MRQIIFLIAPVIFFMLSCKKNIVNIEKSSPVEAKINSWFSQVISSAKLGQTKLKISTMQANLDFENLRYEELNKKEKLIIVPLKETFISDHNKADNPMNCLLLIEAGDGSIRKGNIVQYMPEPGNSTKKIPESLFYNFYHLKEIEDSKFTFLSVNDRLLYEYQYKNGSVYKFSLVRPNTTTTSGNPLDECIDWYWDYYQNGVYIGSEYLYTTCTPEGEVTGNEGGGNGPGSNPPPFPVSKLETWYVASPVSGSWLVWCTEILDGVKANEPGGGHFTSVTHGSDMISNFSVGYVYSWHKGAWASNIQGPLATVSISGHVSGPGIPDVLIPVKSKIFTFPQVFP